MSERFLCMVMEGLKRSILFVHRHSSFRYLFSAAGSERFAIRNVF